MIVYGINPVLEALRAGRAKSVRVASGFSRKKGGQSTEVLALARERGVRVREVPSDVLDRESRHGVHQGVVADVEELKDYNVEDLVRGARAVPLIVVLDGIEDPHNLGAILRTADAAGADGVIMQTRRSAALGGAAAKASAGAVAHIRIAEVVNIARALEELKEAGVWTIGLVGEAMTPYDSIDFTAPSALVLGAEGAGLRRLVRERCDFLASIPMAGHVGSLNVSVAAGVTLFEAVRQRRRAELA
ncbi:MAG: 23S rRNA (guanosine(2251)-2'-O)-methyltransferase RlmB [Actinobacteria bacterium]|nr:23S rRNA (guanosine(2251)-2'-O)-methyltransferase RlmB [Actinomycetota bacterium]